jgi:putative endonuclease
MSKDCFAIAFELARLARHHRKKPCHKAPRKAATPQRSTRAIGLQYEDLALEWLSTYGLIPLARNLRCRAGEIDLALRDGDILVLVEVRARSNARYGGARASVNRSKQARLARAAAYWLPALSRAYYAGITPPTRFDVVAFEAQTPHWLRGAFCLD